MKTSLTDRLLARDPGWTGWLSLACRWTLALAFGYAGAAKLVAPAAMAEAIANYQLVPATLVPWAAAIVPGVELTAAAVLVAGLWVREAAIVIAAMMAVFTVAVVSALLRDLNIECGCFGGDAPLDWTTLVRDLALLTMAVVVARWPSDERPATTRIEAN